MAIPAGYTQNPYGFYFYTDGSGPYAIGQDGIPHLAIEGGGGEGGGSVAVKEDGASVSAEVTALDFLGADFNLTESPAGEVNIVIAAAIARVISDVANTTTANVITIASNAGVINTAKVLNTASHNANTTYTFNGAPANANTWFQLAHTNTDSAAHTLTIPSAFSGTTNAARTTVPVPASGRVLLTFRWDGTGYWVFGDPVDIEVGFRTIPQNSQSAAYTAVAADSAKHIFHPAADTTARVFTIPANASVPYDIGTTLTFVNQNAAGVITIAITSDTMRLAGAGTTGSRTLAANGMATALKITATEWLISGTGLT